MKPNDEMTSLEAAALILSGGKTTDPNKAELMASGQELDLDDLQKAHLRRMMGFDFRIKLNPNKIHVSSKEEPFVTTWCKVNPGETDKYGHIIQEDLIDRMVDACLRLKYKYEAAKQ